eukprot:TRINITY_DN4324_c0_g1_i2.p1 TRINITY_DN4324_c0_g1~~TRINITY_DN4324_c0_g1_i2.p1  ORF type:complete len:957 (+),score=237.79 TRINITY_DN4324_c0_g1_i2:44-2914(+)
MSVHSQSWKTQARDSVLHAVEFLSQQRLRQSYYTKLRIFHAVVRLSGDLLGSNSALRRDLARLKKDMSEERQAAEDEAARARTAERELDMMRVHLKAARDAADRAREESELRDDGRGAAVADERLRARAAQLEADLSGAQMENSVIKAEQEEERDRGRRAEREAGMLRRERDDLRRRLRSDEWAQREARQLREEVARLKKCLQDRKNRAAQRAREPTYPEFGLSLSDTYPRPVGRGRSMDKDFRRRTDGIKVVGVRNAARRAGVMPDDLLREVNGRAVKTLEGFRQAVLELPEGVAVTLTLDRPGPDETGQRIEVVVAPGRSQEPPGHQYQRTVWLPREDGTVAPDVNRLAAPRGMVYEAGVLVPSPNGSPEASPRALRCDACRSPTPARLRWEEREHASPLRSGASSRGASPGASRPVMPDGCDSAWAWASATSPPRDLVAFRAAASDPEEDVQPSPRGPPPRASPRPSPRRRRTADEPAAGERRGSGGTRTPRRRPGSPRAGVAAARARHRAEMQASRAAREASPPTGMSRSLSDYVSPRRGSALVQRAGAGWSWSSPEVDSSSPKRGGWVGSWVQGTQEPAEDRSPAVDRRSSVVDTAASSPRRLHGSSTAGWSRTPSGTAQRGEHTSLQIGARVCRNAAHWSHDNEDGGDGCQGTVTARDEELGVLTVRWDATGVGSSYRYGKDGVWEVTEAEGQSSPAAPRAALERAKQAAIDREDFREAQRIQDQLKAMRPQRHDSTMLAERRLALEAKKRAAIAAGDQAGAHRLQRELDAEPSGFGSWVSDVTADHRDALAGSVSTRHHFSGRTDTVATDGRLGRAQTAQTDRELSVNVMMADIPPPPETRAAVSAAAAPPPLQESMRARPVTDGSLSVNVMAGDVPPPPPPPSATTTLPQDPRSALSAAVHAQPLRDESLSVNLMAASQLDPPPPPPPPAHVRTREESQSDVSAARFM